MTWSVKYCVSAIVPGFIEEFDNLCDKRNETELHFPLAWGPEHVRELPVSDLSSNQTQLCSHLLEILL